MSQGIVKNGGNTFIDIPSRVLFEAYGTPGKYNTWYTFYYSKADGKAYAYCFDPLCSHSDGKCLAQPSNLIQNTYLKLEYMFFINNRFYGVSPFGNIVSFAFDGSDMRMEYDSEYETSNSNKPHWDPNFISYDKYIYVRMTVDEIGNPHTLRFNTETKEMEDLTEKTGNYIAPVFFYNGEIYGRDSAGFWFKADLELMEKESIETQPSGNRFFGTVFFDNAIDSETKEIIGLKSHDIKTGKTVVFTNEMLGLEANRYIIVAVDENYVYFYQYKKIFVGTYIDARGNERTREKENEGKLYRVKHDGTECTLIYDNPEFEFSSMDAVVCGKKLILEGCYIGIRNGVAEVWDSAMKVGTIGEDGKIDKFENIELVY